MARLNETAKQFIEQERQNVFVMMRYGSGDFYQRIEKGIVKTLRKFQLHARIARDYHFLKELWPNIQFCMKYSSYGIVVFEQTQTPPEFNPNVSVELGFMMALGKKVLILKEREFRLHSDIAGFLYKSFDRNTLEKDVERAISDWLRDTGYSPAIQILANPDPYEAKKERTSRIIAALKQVNNQSSTVIRQAGALSSLGIAEEESLLDEPGRDGLLKDLLLKEREIMIASIKSGHTVKIIISPDVLKVEILLHAIPIDKIRSDVMVRIEQLMRTLKMFLRNDCLQIVYVARTPHDNILIAGDEMFVGRRRLLELGFSSTSIIRDPIQINNEIKDFDLLFGDAARAIVDRKIAKTEYGGQELKAKIIEHLGECYRDLEKLARKQKPMARAAKAR